MIILEGPDGAGKTTLIQQLSSELGLPIKEKAMTPDQRPLKEMDRYITENTHGGFQEVLFDRFALISGPLYAPIMNDGYQLNIYNSINWMIHELSELYLNCRPIIIYCLPPISNVRDAVRGDTDNQTVADKTEQIYQAYVARAAIDTSYMRTFIYDYTNNFHYHALKTFIQRHLTTERQKVVSGWR